MRIIPIFNIIQDNWRWYLLSGHTWLRRRSGQLQLLGACSSLCRVTVWGVPWGWDQGFFMIPLFLWNSCKKYYVISFYLDKVARDPNMADSRVHACLYFVAPSGHGKLTLLVALSPWFSLFAIESCPLVCLFVCLFVCNWTLSSSLFVCFCNLVHCNSCSFPGLKPLDIEFMKQLHDKINIIPVIGKADTMTPEEVKTPFSQKWYLRLCHCQVASFKTVIMEQIAAAKIKIYEFPEVMHLPLLRDKFACLPSWSFATYLTFALFHFVFFCRWRMEKRRKGRRTDGWRWDFTRKNVLPPAGEISPKSFLLSSSCMWHQLSLYMVPSNNGNQPPGTRSFCRGGLKHNNRGRRREEKQRSEILWNHSLPQWNSNFRSQISLGSRWHRKPSALRLPSSQEYAD